MNFTGALAALGTNPGMGQVAVSNFSVGFDRTPASREHASASNSNFIVTTQSLASFEPVTEHNDAAGDITHSRGEDHQLGGSRATRLNRDKRWILDPTVVDEVFGGTVI